MLKMAVPDNFSPHIIPVYPPNNDFIFEEWFNVNYIGCNTDRVYLPIFPTSYHVNNNYGQDIKKRKDLQDYVDLFPYNEKYFIICQYDDGCLIDWKGKDVLEFNMSKTNGVMIPLLCQPHPYKFTTPKKWLACFVGGRTHPIRNEIGKYIGKEGYYVSFEQHSPEQYCRILHESIFSLCPRGYGINSFRIAESVQYGSIPVYISDNYIHPYDMDFNSFGVCLNSRHIQLLEETLQRIIPEEIVKKQKNLSEAYEKFYTYESNLKYIINELETEFNLRQSK